MALIFGFTACFYRHTCIFLDLSYRNIFNIEDLLVEIFTIILYKVRNRVIRIDTQHALWTLLRNRAISSTSCLRYQSCLPPVLATRVVSLLSQLLELSASCLSYQSCLLPVCSLTLSCPVYILYLLSIVEMLAKVYSFIKSSF